MTRFWLSALVSVLLPLSAVDASAQCRVEGTVYWADGTPAAAVAISVAELKLSATTDARGRFAFEDIRPGIRITVEALLDSRLLGRSYTLVTLAVERVDMQLAGTPSNPTPAPAVPRGLSRRETAVAAPASFSDGSGTDTVTYDANGMPVVWRSSLTGGHSSRRCTIASSDWCRRAQGRHRPAEAADSRRSSILSRRPALTIRTAGAIGDPRLATCSRSAPMLDATRSTIPGSCGCQLSSLSRLWRGACRSQAISRSPTSANSVTPGSACDGTANGTPCSGRR